LSLCPSIKRCSRFIQSTKTVSIISTEKPVKISSTTSYILSVQAGFSVNRKEKIGRRNIQWYSGDATKPGNEFARDRKWAIQMIDCATSDATSLLIVAVLVRGTVDLFEFRASDGGLFDPTLTRMNEMLKRTGSPRSSQFIREKIQKDSTIFSKKDRWILNLHSKENPPIDARGWYCSFQVIGSHVKYLLHSKTMSICLQRFLIFL
jgi:hypothetical protein